MVWIAAYLPDISSFEITTDNSVSKRLHLKQELSAKHSQKFVKIKRIETEQWVDICINFQFQSTTGKDVEFTIYI